MTDFKTCFSCSGPMSAVREKAEMSLGPRRAVIEVDRYRCGACGEIFYTPDQMDAAQRSLARILREQEGLLAPEKIRAIRESFGLTQAQLEQLLGVGPKTVVRWERGTVFQSPPVDAILRLIEAVPGTFEFLAKRVGLEPQESGGCGTPSGRSQRRTQKYLLPASLRDRRGSTPPTKERRNVTNLAEFKRSQQTEVALQRETEVPAFDAEALK